MSSEPAVFDLRPLTIGEILDRAVTLYIRNFTPLTLIMLFALIPTSLARYYTMQNSMAFYGTLLQQISGTPGHKASPTKINKAFESSPAVGAASVAALVFTIFVLPFANVGIALGVAMVYDARRVDVRLAFLGALRRWPAVLLMGVFEMLAILVWGVAGGLIFGILAVFGVAVGIALPGLRVAGILLLALALLAWLLTFVPLLLAVLLSFCAIGIEHLPAPRAFVQGLARTYSRAHFKRTFLVSLAFLAIQVGSVVVVIAGEAISYLILKSAVFETVVTTLLSMVSAAFLSVVVAVYYYDLRVRLEGLDLRISAPA